MSIPGLGQFASAAGPAASAASAAAATLVTTVALQRFWEFRFDVPVSSSLTIRLLSGIAEKDGTELAPNAAYTFSGTKSKINTWHGCTLEINATNAGAYEAYTAELTEETPLVSYLNLHMRLEGLRAAAATRGPPAMGPRVMVVGPASSGKTSLVRTLTGWATRAGQQPLVVNTDPAQGMLSLPGTLSAAVFPTLADITTEWSGTPSSGPSAIPVKLPLAYYYGLARPEHNPRLFRSLLGRLAAATTSRLSEDPDVRRSGMLIDTCSINTSTAGGDDMLSSSSTSTEQYYKLLTHLVSEFSVNIVISVGSEPIVAELTRRLAGQKTSLGEDISVVGLDKSGGVAERDASFMQRVREGAIKEYFFGDAKRTLSPGTQNIAFEAVTVWRVAEAPDSSPENDDDDFYDPAATDSPLEKAEPSLMMLNCTLAVMYASIRDPPEAIRDANVMGFVYITDVDEKKKRLKVLAPVNARLGDRPLVWGNWPEPMVSLLG